MKRDLEFSLIFYYNSGSLQPRITIFLARISPQHSLKGNFLETRPDLALPGDQLTKNTYTKYLLWWEMYIPFWCTPTGCKPLEQSDSLKKIWFMFSSCKYNLHWQNWAAERSNKNRRSPCCYGNNKNTTKLFGNCPIVVNRHS